MICLLQPVKKEGDDDEGVAHQTPETPSQQPQDQETTTTTNAGEATSEAAAAATTAAPISAPKKSSKHRVSITSLYNSEANNNNGVGGDNHTDFFHTIVADCGKHLDFYEASRLRVGIIIHTTHTTHRALTALASPASSCKVTALAVLKPPPSFSMSNLALEDGAGHLTPGSIMRKWMRDNNLGNHSETVAVLGGEEGAKQIVQRDDVDAVFLIVPDEIHQRYALSALENKKHVLLNDPVSISLQAFNEQSAYARKYGKFVQSSTAFINQYRVRHFMEAVVLDDPSFGGVTQIEAHLSLCSADLEKVGVNPSDEPLGKNQGCIRRLGRYCVLYSILLFTKVGCHPTSVQVHEATVDEASKSDSNGNKGEPTSATCTVNYSDDRKLTFDVSYTSASTTRQQLVVRTSACTAAMSDFVFPHPDGLATYRRYEELQKSDLSIAGIEGIEVMHGEAIDIAGGPTHDVVMWRKFAELSRSVDENGWDDSPLTEQVRHLSAVTLHTKTILNALMKSFESGFVEVHL